MNEKGFTLLEMLVVLLIITLLILLIVPNLGKNSESMHEEGCDALLVTVQTQADLYRLETNKKAASLDILIKEGYLTDKHKKCKSGNLITVSNGEARIN